MTLANPPAASGYMSAERRIGMPTEAIGVCEPMLAEHPFGAVPIATDQAWISEHWADIACRALVELSPSVTKLQCPVRQVSAGQVGPGHPRLQLGPCWRPSALRPRHRRLAV